jgi:hypothetical protein
MCVQDNQSPRLTVISGRLRYLQPLTQLPGKYNAGRGLRARGFEISLLEERNGMLIHCEKQWKLRIGWSSWQHILYRTSCVSVIFICRP